MNLYAARLHQPRRERRKQNPLLNRQQSGHVLRGLSGLLGEAATYRNERSKSQQHPCLLESLPFHVLGRS